MRLRYLYLPRCGPLIDTAVVFGRESLVTPLLGLERKGSLNFIVGVNGSGKSSLLRALYLIFRSLNVREWPALPLTLAWDRSHGSEHFTTVLHFTGERGAAPFFSTLNLIPIDARRIDWDAVVHALANEVSHPMVLERQTYFGHDAITNPLLFAQLPKRMIAYTSGADVSWERLDHRVFRSGDEEGEYATEDERPHGWSMDQEWEEQQPIRIANLLTRYAPKDSGTAQVVPGVGQLGELASDTVSRLQEELKPLQNLRRKLFTNRALQSQRPSEFYFRIQSRHLRLAGITLALLQAAKEMADRTEEGQREALRNNLMEQSGAGHSTQGVRHVLKEIDWFWPTHLSFTYCDADDRVGRREHEELICLIALADEVVAQPRGRQRAILSLGSSIEISLTEKLKDAFPSGIPNKNVDFIANRVDGSKTIAEAILRVFSEDTDIDSTPMDVFARLRDWERIGLLEELTLTIKRLSRTESADGELDDTIVSYDQLSDGEQMLLGRMGLLFLLRGQDGSLLLLDEPETHFNDVWKREIVEMVDVGLLNSTEANVILTTHTSIALTDAFAAEVTVLDTIDGRTTARGVSGGLFGTDPGEVSMNLFRADSSIGSRALEILDQLLKTEWKGREHELEEILNVLGSSFHRAELRAVLKQLRGNTDAPASS